MVKVCKVNVKQVLTRLVIIIHPIVNSGHALQGLALQSGCRLGVMSGGYLMVLTNSTSSLGVSSAFTK